MAAISSRPQYVKSVFPITDATQPIFRWLAQLIDHANVQYNSMMSNG